MTKPREDFKPCPFCEGADIRCDKHHETRSPTGFVWSMCCYNCGATFPNRYKRELLVEAWNRRPTADGELPTSREG